MSKYIKQEDAIYVDCILMDQIECKDCSLYDEERNVCRMVEWLESLPTIEVSEDCISKHDIWKIIEDNAYWVRYNENSTEKGMTLTGINQALNECPPVIPTVSEDCISRADLIESFLADSECKREEAKACMCSIDFMLELIENAPSVVPTTEKSSKVGEWENYKDEHRCSECGEVVIGDWYDDEWYDYCPNCGAKMKGETND